MATRPNSSFVPYLYRIALGSGSELPTDEELLYRYVRHRDEVAFEALMRRHGPMVLGVCRRILGNESDAEDAFQATFLVLVRKASSVRPAGMVGNWLYGVAQRTALKARSQERKRQAKEAQAAARCKPEQNSEAHWRQLEILLDQQLATLPDKYRTAITLCDLEGRTLQQAARQLDWPPGTVATRLTRGRQLLAARLARYGLELSGKSLLVALVTSGPRSSVRAALTSSTLKGARLMAAGQALTTDVISTSAAALTERIVQSMSTTKLQIILTCVFGLLLVSSGAGVLSQGLRTQQRPSEAPTGVLLAEKEDHLKNTLMALHKSLWDAFAKGDPSMAQKLYADDFVSYSPYGRYLKKDAVESIRRYRPTELEIRDVELLRVNKETAILTYVYDVKLLTPDGTLDGVRRGHRISHCWAQRDGGWVLVFAQAFIQPGGE